LNVPYCAATAVHMLWTVPPVTLPEKLSFELQPLSKKTAMLPGPRGTPVDDPCTVVGHAAFDTLIAPPKSV
jgi:hypothetical protein